MTDKDYKNIHEFTCVGGGFLPFNAKSKELVEQTSKGEILSLK